MVMTWSYIAGFFDGEGTVSVPFRDHFTVMASLSQAGDTGISSLTEIKEFLNSNGIHAITRTRKEIYENRKTVHNLYTSGDNALAFLKGVFPYLRVKKPAAQDVIRFRIMYPSMSTSNLAKAYRSERSYLSHGSTNPKTHCPRGHEYAIMTPTKRYPMGQKYCRECCKARQRSKHPEWAVNKVAQ